MKKAYLIAAVVIAVAMGFTLWAFSSSMTPYVDIAAARRSETPVQVRGKILHETAYYDMAKGALRFQIQDAKGEKIEVVYHGAKPDAFDTAPETAAHGMVRDGVFVSDSLVVKCPSKYEDKNGPYKKAQAAGGSR